MAKRPLGLRQYLISRQMLLDLLKLLGLPHPAMVWKKLPPRSKRFRRTQVQSMGKAADKMIVMYGPNGKDKTE